MTTKIVSHKTPYILHYELLHCLQVNLKLSPALSVKFRYVGKDITVIFSMTYIIVPNLLCPTIILNTFLLWPSTAEFGYDRYFEVFWQNQWRLSSSIMWSWKCPRMSLTYELTMTVSFTELSDRLCAITVKAYAPVSTSFVGYINPLA